MITVIRDMRRAKGLTLDDVARRCDPPTTAQTIGRLETGTRTVSVGWLNRIAAALEVEAADLVQLPDRVDLPIAALLDADGARAPTSDRTLAPPRAAAGMIALVATGSAGDYRAGDEIWCEMVAPNAFATALNRDVLVPRSAGRFAFGRLLDRSSDGKLHLLPPGAGSRQQVLADPPWLARAVKLVRAL